MWDRLFLRGTKAVITRLDPLGGETSFEQQFDLLCALVGISSQSPKRGNLVRTARAL